MSAHERTSKTPEWGTPRWVLELAADLFGVDAWELDPCAPAAHSCGERCYDLARGEDGLELPWDARTIWLNPPFGRDVGRWLDKAASVVSAPPWRVVGGILPVRCDAAWWHEMARHASRIVLLEGRVAYVPLGGQAASSPAFPSALVCWDGVPSKAPRPVVLHVSRLAQSRYRRP